jgi:polar amino acid transport system substrate-binding protein
VEQGSPDVSRELAPTGVLRAAINLGNIVLAQKAPDSGELQGASVDLARELSRRLGVPVTLVEFDAAGKVFEAVKSGGLDVVFMAIDPVRAKEVLFTAPYVIIEGTYLVRDGSPLRAPQDFDRPGLRIAVGRGAAYDLFLSRALKHAELVRADTSEDAVRLFVEAGLDAAAGVKQPLVKFARNNNGYRVIEEAFTAIEQAMGTPRGRPVGRRYLQSFVEEMKSSGFVADALTRSGQYDAGVAPPQATWPME